jgi:hypothetical protein
MITSIMLITTSITITMVGIIITTTTTLAVMTITTMAPHHKKLSGSKINQSITWA